MENRSSHPDGASLKESGYKATQMPRIIIAGAPASGKGAQCERIRAKYGIDIIGTGDLLRAAVANDSNELGRAAKSYMDKGETVPDELLVPLVVERLIGHGNEEAQSRGWLLDGFPRTAEQAEALKSAGVVPDLLLVIDVPVS